MFIPTTTLVTFLSVVVSSALVEGSVSHGAHARAHANRNIAPNGLDAREFEARTPTPVMEARSIATAGGWSLSVGNGTCPSGTASCFGDLTGNAMTSNRWNECCPSGTTPMLQCGTYVNTGQPYACCPLENPDCRGDVETVRALNATEACANSGWALWEIPDGGYNRFCCLPGQYGYWYKSLGQDAVGQCSNSSTLPDDATPAVQQNNGDGSVNSLGVQVSALPSPTPSPAPTCDIIAKYGWSLQINGTADGGCTAGSRQCSNYAGACCPETLNCGTVIGDSEVPVCCPASNPDCRGDVEGLWPQVCADSSWALWHVNTNGNHFCCKPGEIGWNIINDNAAVGYCGDHVPVANNTMRSILDYVGDGSTAGSVYDFPCDSSPAPNASLPSIISAILSPSASLNPTSWSTDSAQYPTATASATIDPALTAPQSSATGDVFATITTEISGVIMTIATFVPSDIASEFAAPTETATVAYGDSNGGSATLSGSYAAETGSVETGSVDTGSVKIGSKNGTMTATATQAVFTGGASGKQMIGMMCTSLVAVGVFVGLML